MKPKQITKSAVNLLGELKKKGLLPEEVMRDVAEFAAGLGLLAGDKRDKEAAELLDRLTPERDLLEMLDAAHTIAEREIERRKAANDIWPRVASALKQVFLGAILKG